MLLRMHVNDHTVNDLTIDMFLSILFDFFFYNFINFNQNVIPWSSVETSPTIEGIVHLKIISWFTHFQANVYMTFRWIQLELC